MTTESLAIVGLTLVALALPAMGAWFYQVFALKRELADVERRIGESDVRQDQHLRDIEARLTERVKRIEDAQLGLVASLGAALDKLRDASVGHGGRLDTIEKLWLARSESR